MYIGTSGWHYNDWLGSFYPPEVKGYHELTYHSQHFNTVENNSSFYRIAQESTYKTWFRMTPDNYVFSLKLNKAITHNHRLKLSDEVQELVSYILTSTQVLKNKIGAIVIQLPPSFKLDIERVTEFLMFFKTEIRKQEYSFDVAIEFRNKAWFIPEVYSMLKKHSVALVAADSSRYSGTRQITADFCYVRMHGPKELFSSKYTTEQLAELASYLKSIQPEVKRTYVYFNNDFHGYALENARELAQIVAEQ